MHFPAFWPKKYDSKSIAKQAIFTLTLLRYFEKRAKCVTHFVENISHYIFKCLTFVL